MIREHLWGIVNAIIFRATNGPAEGINSRIKTVKVRSRGFRNRDRFANAILFHLGGLDLYPDGLPACTCYPSERGKNRSGVGYVAGPHPDSNAPWATSPLTVIGQLSSLQL